MSQKAIVEGAIKAASFTFFKSYIFPYLPVVITALIGVMNDVHLFWIWLGVLASFAFVFTGLNAMQEWLYKMKVQDKVTFSRINILRDINSGGLCAQVIITSSADFPVSWKLSKLNVRLGDKVPKEETKSEIVYSIPLKGIGWYNSSAIHIENPPKPGTIEGIVDFEFEYGRPNNVTHKLQGKKQIVVVFNQDGVFESYAWNDAI